MKIKPHLILLTALLVAQPVFSTTVFGDPDCGIWLSKHSAVERDWLLGFLTGLNAMHSVYGKDDPLSKINSPQQIFFWMDNYCQKNPLKSIADGGIQLFFDLKTKKQ